jgi:integrase
MSNNLLSEALLKNKPNLSRGSIRTYLSGFKILAEKIGIKLDAPEDFIENKNKILDFLKIGNGLNTPKTKIAGILSLIKPAKKDELEKLDKNTLKVIREYTDHMMSLHKQHEEKNSEQEMSESQKENYLEWDKVMNIYERLKKVATPLFKLDPKTVNADVKDILVHFVLLSLYVLIPPRRSLDYVAMKIRNFDTSENSKDNYFVDKTKKEKPHFIFNTYKNASRLGKQIIAVPPPLLTVLKNWMKFNDSDFLIPNKKGERIQDNKITIMLNDIFKRNLGPSLLRHSYITKHFGNVNLKEMQLQATALGQSNIGTMLSYVDKSEAKKERESKIE